MAYSSSIHEILRLGDISLQVYRQCRDSPGQYKHLANDARQLHSIWIDLCDLIKQYKVPAEAKSELIERGFQCRDVLSDVEATIRKYNGKSLKSKREWDKQSWDDQGGRGLQLKLNACTIELSSFHCSLILSAQAKIQDALSLLITDYLSSNTSGTTTSMLEAAVEAANGRDEVTWQQLIRDLEGLGITEAVASENRPVVVERLERVMNGDLVDDDSSDQSSTRQLSIHGSSSVPTIPAMRRTELDAGAAGPSNWTGQGSSLAPITTYPTEQTAALEPPPYEDLSNPAIFSMAQTAVEAWNTRNWPVAMAAIEEIIQAVQSGGTVEVDGGGRSQPDMRLLQHLMGVAASYEGELETAKKWFEMVLDRPYTKSIDLDEAECAAARWLGDTCIMLDEPKNGIFAWAMSFTGQPGGTKSLIGAKICGELKTFDVQIQTVRTLLASLERQNKDPTTIFKTASLGAKIHAISYAYKKMEKVLSEYGSAYKRHGKDVNIKQDYLLRPMTGLEWPIPWDPLFSASKTATFIRTYRDCRMNRTFSNNPSKNPDDASHSMKSMPYTTKRDLAWLTATIRAYLEQHNMPFLVMSDHFTVTLDQSIKGVFFREHINIDFKKVSMRTAYGFRITDTESQTRAFMFGEEEEQRRQRQNDALTEKLILHVAAADRESGTSAAGGAG